MIKPVELQIRFSDIDSMGHVNNAVYLSYFEYTRVYYFKALLSKAWDWESNGIILAHTEVSFLSPLLLNDKANVEMRIGHIGTKSFTLHYIIRVKNEIITKGASTLVCYNSTIKESITIPLKMKEALTKLSYI
jgi:acyl-CoA thioester hydrolase